MIAKALETVKNNLLFAAIIFACVPVKPPPEPEPRPSIETRREDFSASLGLWWVNGARASTWGGKLVLDSQRDGTSAWAFSSPVHVDSLISMTVRVARASDDFAFGFAPTRLFEDFASENGLYSVSTAIRYYIAAIEPARRVLWRRRSDAGIVELAPFSELFTGTWAPSKVFDPCEIKMEFLQGREIAYSYRDSLDVWSSWAVVGRENLPTGMLGEYLTFELAAYSTPYKGIALVDKVEMQYIAASSETLTVLLLWNPNREPDLAGYRVYQLPSNARIVVTGTEHARLAGGRGRSAYVTAFDTAGNESVPSDTVQLLPLGRTGIPARGRTKRRP